ncbi:MAG: cytochrome C oxidase subunit IV family protein [Acidobacteria bacterium]|nr:cytochrome C oxidase subunit IV family protein [Acidobacteriota bacterium]
MTQHNAGGAAHADHAEPNYMAVFVALAVLTVVEVVMVFMPISRLAIGAILVTLAFTKAILVAMYFMHLKFEKRTLAVIAATPIALCVFLMFMLLPDADPAKVKHPAAPPAPAAATHP